MVWIELPGGIEQARYKSRERGLAALGALLKEYEHVARRIAMLDSQGRLISFTLSNAAPADLGLPSEVTNEIPIGAIESMEPAGLLQFLRKLIPSPFRAARRRQDFPQSVPRTDPS